MATTTVYDAKYRSLGVLVVGMHRSGTSMVTRAVNLLGLPTCLKSDLVPASPSNERGHWESSSLAAFNNCILRQLGRSSVCPPALGVWAEGPEIAGLSTASARRLLEEAHPTPQWVWKDPRTCVTLPFWRAALHDIPLVLVMAVRHPLEVAESLHRRDGLPHHTAMCLWERYVRHAFNAAAGLPVLVTHYDRMLSDPDAWVRQAADLLCVHGARMRSLASACDGIRGHLHVELRHHHATTIAAGASEHGYGWRPIYAMLQELNGPIERFEPPRLPTEDPDVEEELLTFSRSRRQIDRPRIAGQPRNHHRLSALDYY